MSFKVKHVSKVCGKWVWHSHFKNIISPHRIQFVVYNLDMFLLAVKATSKKLSKIIGGQYGRVAENG